MSATATISPDLVLWRDLVGLKGAIERALEQRLQRDAGISVADFDILTTLCSADGERLRARDLGELLGWEKSRLSHQVTRMETRGLVRRQDCPTDLRGTWIVITDSGHAAAARGLAGHAEILDKHFSVLEPDPRRALEDAVRTVTAASEAPVCSGSDDTGCTV